MVRKEKVKANFLSCLRTRKLLLPRLAVNCKLIKSDEAHDKGALCLNMQRTVRKFDIILRKNTFVIYVCEPDFDL